MNSSVKFFEPTVMTGADSAPWTGWMSLELAPPPVVADVELLDLLLSLLPHAARASAATAASSVATAGRVFRRVMVLLVGGDLRPRGVTARCRPAKRASDASA